MNKAITDGLVLMPPAFAGGLGVWSKEDGTAGSATYSGDPNAALVPADADFAGCLELIKTDAVQKLRWTGETPILPGCYLRVTARVIPAGPLEQCDQRGQVMRLQLFQRAPEQELGPQPHAMNGARAVLAEIDLIEIGLENFLLAVVQLQQDGHGHFQQLARQGSF